MASISLASNATCSHSSSFIDSKPISSKSLKSSIFLPTDSLKFSIRNATSAQNLRQFTTRVELKEATKTPSSGSSDSIPTPIVAIDQHSDESFTIVDLEFGNRLGALLDTMTALTSLGLNVVKAKIYTGEDNVGRNRFLITRSDNGQKVEEPDMLEAIRLTIMENLLQYHPESGNRLALADVYSSNSIEREDVKIKTQLSIETMEGGKQSKLKVVTADRPGLIMEIVKELVDMSISVESAEIDTEGLIARDEFYVSYHGKALNSSMVEVTLNVLRYYLDKNEIETEDSY